MQNAFINEAKILNRSYLWMIYYTDNDGNELDTITSASNIKDALKVGMRLLKNLGIPTTNITTVKQFKLVETYNFEEDKING